MTLATTSPRASRFPFVTDIALRLFGDEDPGQDGHPKQKALGSTTEITCFKTYDVRGRIGIDLTSDIAYRIGVGFARVMTAKTVVVGRDCRESSPNLARAMCQGLTHGGADVLDIGLAGTEEVYFATYHYGACGGLMVTASHNPIEYNGIKMVGPGSRPIDPENELLAIRRAAEGTITQSDVTGEVYATAHRDAYATKIARFVEASELKPLKVLVNAGNGVAGPALDAILAKLASLGAKLEIVRLHHEPDGMFPHGIPNPLLAKNRSVTADAVRSVGADLGVAWDGDFDRCFLFDETGAFVDGEYIVGLLAQVFLKEEPGARIVHDPRVVWNTQACVAEAGGTAVQSKTGHAYVKATMRESGAVYGGEMSAHHYFRDFMACDSGMIPWLKLVQLMSVSDEPLSYLVDRMKSRFPSSGERNFRVDDADARIEAILARFSGEAKAIEHFDGVSLTFADWRMNVRRSNTEPLLRLNVETRDDPALLAQRLAEVETVLAA